MSEASCQYQQALKWEDMERFSISLLRFYFGRESGGCLLHPKSNWFAWRIRRWQEERANFLKQLFQLGIVDELDFLNLIETFLKIASQCEFFAHPFQGLLIG